VVAKSSRAFIEVFSELEDYRADEKVLFPLNEILFLAIVSVLTRCEGWVEIYNYGQNKLELLRKYFPYTHGIPSVSTICTVIGMIDKRKFEGWFTKWSQNLVNILPDELIAIDGKTIRGSRTETEKATHVLNAFATKNGIVIAQRTVDVKTNEIPEIPKLLDDLNIKGAVVSTDAMGCQKAIALKIKEKEADYFLALKKNHGDLFFDVEAMFSTIDKKLHFYEEINKGHGRIEVRRCWSLLVPDWVKMNNPGWESLTSICLIESERHIRGAVSIEHRYYISSTEPSIEKHFGYARMHWGVESVHWVLDVTFKEDQCLVKNAAENMSVVRKVIMNLIKKYKDRANSKASLSIIRHTAMLSDDVAQGILSGLFA